MTTKWSVDGIGLSFEADGASIIVRTVDSQGRGGHILVVSHQARLHCEAEIQPSGIGRLRFCIEEGSTRITHSSTQDDPESLCDAIVHALMQAKHVARAYDRGR